MRWKWLRYGNPFRPLRGISNTRFRCRRGERHIGYTVPMPPRRGATFTRGAGFTGALRLKGRRENVIKMRENVIKMRENVIKMRENVQKKSEKVYLSQLSTLKSQILSERAKRRERKRRCARVTVQELQQLFYLNKLIERERKQLEDLRSSLGLRSPALTDMPKAPGAKDRIGDIVPDIVDQEEEIEKNLRAYTEARNRLTEYINRVPNARIKTILILRFIDQKPWQEVAEVIGGRETEYSVKQACYRYVDGKTIPEWMGNQISFFDAEGTQNV